MDENYMITTPDNPYNYFTQFDQWLAWDRDQGYDTLELLDRVTVTSPDLTQGLDEEAITIAMDYIVTELLPGIYIKVEPPKSE